jgi:ribosomal protein S18 acetylase RimI-like enzyme
MIDMAETEQRRVLKPLRALESSALRSFLLQFPQRDVYLRGLVGTLGTELPPELGTLLGWWVDGELRGVFVHGQVMVLCCEDPRGLEAFAERVGHYWHERPIAQLMAPRAMCEVFLAALSDHFGSLPPLHLLRHRMPAMRVRADILASSEALGLVGSLRTPPLRLAQENEERVVAQLARSVTQEDLGLDPLEFAPQSFEFALRHRLKMGREFIWTEGPEAVFRATLSAITPDSVMVEGVFVPPRHRGRGYGKAGMRALCERLLRTYDTVVLLVGEDNEVARRLYEVLGFETFDEYQAAFFEVRLSEASPRLSSELSR